MKGKILGGILMVIAIGFIFSGSSIEFLTGFQIDKHKTFLIEENIDTSYQKITSDMEKLRQSMTEMQPFFSLYYENVESEKAFYQQKLQEIKKELNEIDFEIQKVNDNCQLSVNKESKAKCKSLQDNRKTAQETYNQLETTYDEFLQQHDDWVKSVTIAMAE